MALLILSARQTVDAQKLWRACIAAGWRVERAHGWHVPDADAAEAVVYGEPLFAEHVAQTLGLRLLAPTVDWLARLPGRWCGRDVRFMTLGEARAVSGRAFIKPAEEKCFEAKVYAGGHELPAPGPLPETLPVLVQEMVEWTVEYRCFVSERRVAAVSAYWREGLVAKDNEGMWIATEEELAEAARFAETVLADEEVQVPAAVVLDVGVIRGKGWAVVESNAAWASGIYGCDPVAVLGVLRRACEPD